MDCGFQKKNLLKEKQLKNNMKKLSILIFVAINSVLLAQNLPTTLKTSSSSSEGLKINSRRSVLIEKQIFNFGKFKNLNIQKIVSKDMSDNSTEKVLGIMSEFETYDNISKMTLTIDKSELSKLIQSLQILEKKENEKTETETKYKFHTFSNIEFGGVFNEESKKWTNYIRFPSTMYSQNLNEYSKDELKDLINLFIKVEKEL